MLVNTFRAAKRGGQADSKRPSAGNPGLWAMGDAGHLVVSEPFKEACFLKNLD